MGVGVCEEKKNEHEANINIFITPSPKKRSE